jgi:hypothetical protein
MLSSWLRRERSWPPSTGAFPFAADFVRSHPHRSHPVALLVATHRHSLGIAVVRVRTPFTCPAVCPAVSPDAPRLVERGCDLWNDRGWTRTCDPLMRKRGRPRRTTSNVVS